LTHPFDRTLSLLDAEQTFLGGLLLSTRARGAIAREVRPEHMSVKSHRQIYQAMIDLWDRGQMVGVRAVRDQLAADGTLDEAGGERYLASLTAFDSRMIPARDLALVIYGAFLGRSEVCQKADEAS